MTRPPSSIREVVSRLAREFDGHVAPGDVAEAVERLSANGAVSLPVLEHLARVELTARGGPASTAGADDAARRDVENPWPAPSPG